MPRTALPITVLHVSDVHFGSTDLAGEVPIVTGSLIESAHSAEIEPDLVVFTGDLANRGTLDEMKRGRAWLARLVSKWGCPLAIVPGNHDVDRSKADRKRLRAADRDLPTFEEWKPELLADLTRLDAFFDEFRGGEPVDGLELALDWGESRLAGSNELDIRGRRVALLGLNTALLSCGDDDTVEGGKGEGRLAIDLHTLNDFLGRHDPAKELVLVLGHHPFEGCLAPWNAKEVEAALQRGNHGAHAWLHGHLHAPRASFANDSRGRSLAPLAAGAAYQTTEYPQHFAFYRFGVGADRIGVDLFVYSVDQNEWHRDAAQSQPMLAKLPEAWRPGASIGIAAARAKGPTPDERETALREYLASLVRLHAELVPFFQDKLSDSAFERVGVELGVAPDKHLDLERKAGKLALQELIELDPRRWVVRGDPGCGKTTMLRHLTWKLARRTDRPWIPIYLAASDLGRVTESPWKLVRERALLQGNHPALADELDVRRDVGQVVVLTDGLDEVPRAQLSTVRGNLHRLAGELGRSALVVTTRRIGYDPLDGGFAEAIVQPLDRPAQIDLLGRCLPDATSLPTGRSVDDWVDHFARHPNLARFAENPLLLTMMAVVIRKGEDEPSSLRSELYRQVLTLLLRGEHKPEPHPIPLEDTVRLALSELAFRMTSDGLVRTTKGRLELGFLAAAREHADLRLCFDQPDWEQGASAVLESVQKETGILAAYEASDPTWRFWHRSFQEALTCEALLRWDDVRRAAFLRELRTHLNLWAEPFALLAGCVADPDALIRTLVEVHPQLGLRALATAERVKPETIQQVLGLAEGVEERGAVLGRIVELVGDPEKGLELLDRLRQECAERADLYFLHRAFERVARETSQLAEFCAQYDSRLCAHLDPPKGDLFERVATRDGSVPLWRSIPAGRFLMGSPDDEPGRWDNEGPQHEVVIDAAFEMTAVPVTNAQYHAFDPHHRFPKGREHHPVVEVSWYEAWAFCRWLGARLPSEAEWECACRGKKTTPYWSGRTEKDLERVGWYSKNSGGRTHAVGELPANPFGLYDVHGNVWEWCQDVWSDDYGESMAAHPRAFEAEDAGARIRVTRGGSFAREARLARSAYRGGWHPGGRDDNLGFRPARRIT